MRHTMIKGCIWTVVALLAIAGSALGFLVYQAHRAPEGRPEYVALGSSFAAGAGLGPLQRRSPLLCARSIDGYPQQLARMLRLSIVDMSCGGATAKQVLDGGQFFQGPQVRAVDIRTRLVTITVGGNDIGYIGDLSMLAARNSGSAFGWLVGHVWSGPKDPLDRDYRGLERNLAAMIGTIRKQAPNAVVVLATYPAILPPSGTCARIGLSTAEADLMRRVALRLEEATRGAAVAGHVLLVDMQVLGKEHNACSNEPWTRGWTNGGIAPFHPTLIGARATARAIAETLRGSPAGVTAVRKNDASGHEAGGVGREEQHD